MCYGAPLAAWLGLAVWLSCSEVRRAEPAHPGLRGRQASQGLPPAQRHPPSHRGLCCSLRGPKPGLPVNQGAVVVEAAAAGGAEPAGVDAPPPRGLRAHGRAQGRGRGGGRRGGGGARGRREGGAPRGGGGRPPGAPAPPPPGASGPQDSPSRGAGRGPGWAAGTAGPAGKKGGGASGEGTYQQAALLRPQGARLDSGNDRR